MLQTVAQLMHASSLWSVDICTDGTAMCAAVSSIDWCACFQKCFHTLEASELCSSDAQIGVGTLLPCMPATAQQHEGAAAFRPCTGNKQFANDLEADAGILGNIQPVLTADPGLQTNYISSQEASMVLRPFHLQGLHSSGCMHSEDAEPARCCRHC